MKQMSLRFRLALAGLIAIVGALGLAGLGLTWLFERHAYRTLAVDLDGYVRQIVGGLEVEPGGAVILPRPPRDPRFEAPLSGLYWEIIGDGKILRSRSLWDATLALPSDHLSAGQTHYHQLRGPDDKILLAAELRIAPSSNQSPPFRIVVASDLTRLRGARNAFAADLGPGLAGLGLLLLAGTWIQLGLGLRPLARLRLDAAAVAEGRERRLTGPVPPEVQPLVAEINGLLDARDAEIERARGRAADLAHGLKTPLTALAGDAQDLRDLKLDDLAASIEAVGETMRRHVERELARARLRGANFAAGAPETQAAPIVDALIRTLKRTEKGAAISIVNELSPFVTVRMDRADLTEILGNIMDNAVRYATTMVLVSEEFEGWRRRDCRGGRRTGHCSRNGGARPQTWRPARSIRRCRTGFGDRSGHPRRLSLENGIRPLAIRRAQAAHTGRWLPDISRSDMSARRSSRFCFSALLRQS